MRAFPDTWPDDMRDLARRIEAGESLSAADGLRLYTHPDWLAVGQLANRVRERRHGDRTYFVVNRHLNYTNVCLNECRFCAFHRRPGQPGAYTMGLDEVRVLAAGLVGSGVREVHVVGGLHPELPYAYYLELVGRLRDTLPGVDIKAFTMVEIDHIARVGGCSVRQALADLQAAGLTSLPGGGAEVFDAGVRARLCPRKINAERWLEIARTAHELGLPTNATLLYGHVETLAQRVEHLVRLREAQRVSGGFLAFIPLAVQPGRADGLTVTGTTGHDDLRTLAVARLMLDNIPHIKAYWVMLGTRVAQLAQLFGADDLDGTVLEERIGHSAGADAPRALTRTTLTRLIQGAGRRPVERDARYRLTSEWRQPGEE